MGIVFGGLAPHPPLLIPEIGRRDRDQVSLTDQALRKLAGLLVHSEPDILVIISPHGPVFSEAIGILHSSIIHGDFKQFGVPQVHFEEQIDLEFINALHEVTLKSDIILALMNDMECEQYNIDVKLDHGIMVPLHYFRWMGLKSTLVPITMGMLPYEDLYKFGTMIQKASERIGKRVAVVASGDLSHRLTPTAPAGFNPRGKEFDQFIIKTLKRYRVEELFDIKPSLIEKAGECGLRPLIMMLGALNGLEVESEVISYEGPFGVGYGVASFTPSEKKIPSIIEKIYEKRFRMMKEIQCKEHPLVLLARQTIINNSQNKKTFPPEELTSEMKKQAGVFVSIKKHGQLRGCIGTTHPTQKNVSEEIIQNAKSAAFDDPRFFPIEENELNDLTISVDVLEDPEPIDSIKDLDPVCYGVIVKQGRRSGLLLPDLEGIDTAKKQVEFAKRKAGILSNEDIELSRFKVSRYY